MLEIFKFEGYLVGGCYTDMITTGISDAWGSDILKPIAEEYDNKKVKVTIEIMEDE